MDVRDRSAPVARSAIPPLAAALREVGIAGELATFVKSFFERGAVPYFGLILDPRRSIEPAEAEALRQKFIERSGLQRAVDPVILQSIKDVKRLRDRLERTRRPPRFATSPRSTSVPRSACRRSWSASRPGSTRRTYSNYFQARQAFYEDTILPLWARLDGALSRSLLPEFTANPGSTWRSTWPTCRRCRRTGRRRFKTCAARCARAASRRTQLRAESGCRRCRPKVGDLLYVPLFVGPKTLTGEQRPSTAEIPGAEADTAGALRWPGATERRHIDTERRAVRQCQPADHRPDRRAARTGDRGLFRGAGRTGDGRGDAFGVRCGRRERARHRPLPGTPRARCVRLGR